MKELRDIVRLALKAAWLYRGWMFKRLVVASLLATLMFRPFWSEARALFCRASGVICKGQSDAPVEPLDRGRSFGVPSFGNGTTVCLDPAASFCATSSDQNNCSCNCTGGSTHDGPCLHFFELLNRWQTLQPFFNANTTINLKSGQANAQDPITLTPYLVTPDGVNNVSLDLVCTLPAPQFTTTIATLTSASPATNQALILTYTAGAVTLGQFVQNTTRGSFAWQRRVSGNFFSQPGSTTALPADNITFTADNGWAVGNNISVYSAFGLFNAYVVKAGLEGTEDGVNGGSAIHIKNCNLPSAAGSGVQISDMTDVQRGVYLVESSVARGLSVKVGSTTNKDNSKFQNDYMIGGFLGGQIGMNPISPAGRVFIDAGVLSVSGGNQIGVGVQGAAIQNNTVIIGLNASPYLFGYNMLVGVEIEGPNSLTLMPGSGTNLNSVAGVGLVWGTTGGINNEGTVCYPPGAGKAATTFVTGGTLLLATGAAGCLQVPTVASPTLTCNEAITAANFDAVLGATSGSIISSSASYTNLNACN